jgi:hypothetical protein
MGENPAVRIDQGDSTYQVGLYVMGILEEVAVTVTGTVTKTVTFTVTVTVTKTVTVTVTGTETFRRELVRRGQGQVREHLAVRID